MTMMMVMLIGGGEATAVVDGQSTYSRDVGFGYW